jgi:hypothetical protein
LDKRLARDESWSRTHVYKSRKKSTTQKTPTKNYQQTDLHGDNIDAIDGEAFGDTFGEKAKKTVRIMSQNINGLPAHRSHYKSQQIMKTICTGSADLWMIQEVGLCWPLINEADQWNVRTRIKGARIHSSLGYNKKEIEISEPLQAGGVGVIATNIMTPRCTSKGTDPSGLGRWAWTRIEGTTGFHSRIVSVYRPCTPSQQGAGTVYEQHRRTFPADTDPREAILDDLKVEIVQWQEEGDVIVLGMDANEDTRSKTISDFFEELNMKNAILTRHSHLSPPATHTRNKNREPIDGIWVSKGIDPIGAGFLACGDACPSDHVALWVDFNQSDLLGEKLESFAVSINRMKSDDPRLVTKYNQLSKKALRSACKKQKLSHRSFIDNDGFLWRHYNQP